MGRIEHTLLDEGKASSPTDLRPSPPTPLSTTPYHIKLQMFLFATKGRSPVRGELWELRPYDRSRCAEHVGATVCCTKCCARPTEGSHGRTTGARAQRRGGAERRPRCLAKEGMQKKVSRTTRPTHELLRPEPLRTPAHSPRVLFL